MVGQFVRMSCVVEMSLSSVLNEGDRGLPREGWSAKV